MGDNSFSFNSNWAGPVLDFTAIEDDSLSFLDHSDANSDRLMEKDLPLSAEKVLISQNELFKIDNDFKKDYAKAASQKYREKRKRTTEDLETKVHALHSENAALRDQVKRLTSQVSILESQKFPGLLEFYDNYNLQVQVKKRRSFMKDYEVLLSRLMFLERNDFNPKLDVGQSTGESSDSNARNTFWRGNIFGNEGLQACLDELILSIRSFHEPKEKLENDGHFFRINLLEVEDFYTMVQNTKLFKSCSSISAIARQLAVDDGILIYSGDIIGVSCSPEEMSKALKFAFLTVNSEELEEVSCSTLWSFKREQAKKDGLRFDVDDLHLDFENMQLNRDLGVNDFSNDQTVYKLRHVSKSRAHQSENGIRSDESDAPSTRLVYNYFTTKAIKMDSNGREEMLTFGIENHLISKTRLSKISPHEVEQVLFSCLLSGIFIQPNSSSHCVCDLKIITRLAVPENNLGDKAAIHTVNDSNDRTEILLKKRMKWYLWLIVTALDIALQHETK